MDEQQEFRVVVETTVEKVFYVKASDEEAIAEMFSDGIPDDLSADQEEWIEDVLLHVEEWDEDQ